MTLNPTPSLANGNGIVPTVGGAAVAASNPFPMSFGTGVTLPAFTAPPAVALNTTPTVANGNGVVVANGATAAAVKAASTAALAADPALVVAVSPNNTPVLPSGAATAANQAGQQLFTPNGTISNQAVTTSSAPFTLPAGSPAPTIVVVDNTGNNQINFAFGASVTATSGNPIQPNSWKAFTIPSGATQYAVIGVVGPSTVNVAAGTGMPMGAGDGAGAPVGQTGTGLPGSEMTMGMSVAGNVEPLIGGANGQDIDVLTTSQLHTDLTNLNASINSATPSGTNIVGKFGIDQTTVGTTNGVALAQVGSTAIATGTGASNGGTQRVALSTDSPGGASANPAYVQAQANVTANNASGAGVIATANVAVNAITASSTLHGGQVCNFDVLHPSGGEPAWISWTTTALANDYTNSGALSPPSNSSTMAGAGCFTLPPGFNGNLSFVAATAGHKLTIMTW